MRYIVEYDVSGQDAKDAESHTNRAVAAGKTISTNHQTTVYVVCLKDGNEIGCLTIIDGECDYSQGIFASSLTTV